MNNNQKQVIACRAFYLLRNNSNGIVCKANGYWSYPAFFASPRGELQWLFVVLPIVPILKKKRTALFRPSYLVLTELYTNYIVKYENFKTGHNPFPTQDWEKPIAMFPHKSIANYTYKELEENEIILWGLYEEAAIKFKQSGKLPEQFRNLYLKLLHPIVLPYLQYLSPHFFDALQVEKTPSE